MLIHTVGEKSIEQNAIYGVKLSKLQAMWAGQGVDPPLEKWIHFY